MTYTIKSWLKRVRSFDQFTKVLSFQGLKLYLQDSFFFLIFILGILKLFDQLLCLCKFSTALHKSLILLFKLFNGETELLLELFGPFFCLLHLFFCTDVNSVVFQGLKLVFQLSFELSVDITQALKTGGQGSLLSDASFVLFDKFGDFVFISDVFVSKKSSVFLSFSSESIKLHRFAILLLDDSLKLLFLQIFLVPKRVCFLIFSLNENYVIVLELDGLHESLFFIFIVND